MTPWSSGIYPRKQAWFNVIYHTNRMKNIKPYDYLNRCRRSIWKNLTSLYAITINKLGIKKYLSIIQTKYDIPITNIILNGKKSESFSIKNWKKTRMPILTTLTQHITGSTMTHQKEADWRKKWKDPNKKRSQTISLHWWYGSVSRKP